MLSCLENHQHGTKAPVETPTLVLVGVRWDHLMSWDTKFWLWYMCTLFPLQCPWYHHSNGYYLWLPHWNTRGRVYIVTRAHTHMDIKCMHSHTLIPLPLLPPSLSLSCAGLWADSCPRVRVPVSQSVHQPVLPSARHPGCPHEENTNTRGSLAVSLTCSQL